MPALTAQQRFELVGAILALPEMATLVRREQIIRELGEPMAGAVQSDTTARAHVLNIVTVCSAYPNGFVMLRQSLEFYYTGTTAFAVVAALFDEYAPVQIDTSRKEATSGTTVDDGSATIDFKEHIRVDRASVDIALQQLGRSEVQRITINWHPKIIEVYDLIDSMRDNIDEKMRYFVWSTAPDASTSRSFQKTSFYEMEEAAERVRVEVTLRLDDVLRLTERVDHQYRADAITAFCTFGALRIVSFLQCFSGNLCDKDNNPIYRLFNDLAKVVPNRWFKCLPYTSTTGLLAFGEGRFLRCRVGFSERNYQILFLPAHLAIEYQDERGLPLDVYYRWVLPQWLHKSAEATPPAESCLITTVKDEFEREKWSAKKPAPWDNDPNKVDMDDEPHFMDGQELPYGRIIRVGTVRTVVCHSEDMKTASPPQDAQEGKAAILDQCSQKEGGLCQTVPSSNGDSTIGCVPDKPDTQSALPSEQYISASRPKALIMKGGGVLGLAYIGALQELVKCYTFDWFVGTSAGAIVAVLLATGYTPKDLEEILCAKSFRDFLDAKPWAYPTNLIYHHGLHPADAFETWLDRLLAEKLNSPVEVRLCDLPQHVTIYACVEDEDAVMLDSTQGKYMQASASWAVRCSMSIPFLFWPKEIEGKKVVDGGVRHNYPVDQILTLDKGADFIGLYLGPRIFEHPKRPNSLIRSLLFTWMTAKEPALLRDYKDRTIIIDTRPISFMDFNIGKRAKAFLLSVGKVAALEFIQQNRSGSMTGMPHSDLEISNAKSENERNLDELTKHLKIGKMYRRALAILISVVGILLILMTHGTRKIGGNDPSCARRPITDAEIKTAQAQLSASLVTEAQHAFQVLNDVGCGHSERVDNILAETAQNADIDLGIRKQALDILFQRVEPSEEGDKIIAHIALTFTWFDGDEVRQSVQEHFDTLWTKPTFCEQFKRVLLGLQNKATAETLRDFVIRKVKSNEAANKCYTDLMTKTNQKEYKNTVAHEVLHER